MMKKISNLRKNNKGFTLVELLVVIAIIAILVAVIAPRVVQTLDDAKTTSGQAIEQNIQNALERYYFDEGSYPAKVAGDGTDLDGLSPKYLVDKPGSNQKYDITYSFDSDNKPVVKATAK